MRLLTEEETNLVSGGDAPICTPADAMNDFYGIQNTSTFGQDIINIYEGLVFATSHVMERVAAAFKD